MLRSTNVATTVVLALGVIGGASAQCSVGFFGSCDSGDLDICGGTTWNSWAIYNGDKIASGKNPVQGEALDSSLPYTVDITALSTGGSWKTVAAAYGATDADFTCSYTDLSDTTKPTECRGTFAC